MSTLAVPDPAVVRFLETHTASAAALPGHGVPWLDELRAAGLARFRAQGFPTPRSEAWKYTDVAPIARRSFRPASGEDETPAEAIREAVARAARGIDADHRLVFVNGRYRPEFSATGEARDGRVVGSLAGHLRDDPESLRRHLAQPPRRADGFAALNAAFAADGLYVVLPAGSGAGVIHLCFVAAGEDVASHARSLVVAGPGSSAVLVESYVSAGDTPGLVNVATDLALAAGASVEHYRAQQENDRSYHVGAVTVRQADDSRYRILALGLGGRIGRCDIDVSLDAEGAECTLEGLYAVRGRQHIDFHTRIDHRKPRGVSRELFKGILDGHGRGVFNGKVVVHEDAQRTDATQANHNLLLSRHAEIDTKPELEIYADDVKCSHGATVGQLDEDMLFYLRSRGLDEGLARATLTYAFAEEVLGRIGLVGLRRQAAAALARIVPGAEAALGGELDLLLGREAAEDPVR